ncbi:P-loop containing nucleoside triphosphate hydrolase protein [Gaertneriomyces semiglobifer]|nr:P-loop containing nucleoside triphosphate hydrolase protein [Gaertneriomyces semiglobifer]
MTMTTRSWLQRQLGIHGGRWGSGRCWSCLLSTASRPLSASTSPAGAGKSLLFQRTTRTTTTSSTQHASDEAKDGQAFTSLPLHPLTLTALQTLSITHPTPPQHLSIPAILNSTHTLIEAPTGSGKTLAYLLPLLTRLLTTDALQLSKKTDPLSPRCLILVPTKELGIQTVKVLSRFLAPNNAHTQDRQWNLKATLYPPPVAIPLSHLRHPDIIITTPAAIPLKPKHRRAFLERTQWCVVDECDVVIADPVGLKVIQDIAATNKKRLREGITSGMEIQCVFVGATIPQIKGDPEKEKSPRAVIHRLFKDVTTASHASVESGNLVEEFIAIPANDSDNNVDDGATDGSKGMETKLATLLSLFARPRAPHTKNDNEKWLIFCNTHQRATILYQALQRLVSSSALPNVRVSTTVGVENHERTMALSSFTTTAPASPSESSESSESSDTDATDFRRDVLVTTPLASRGLDFRVSTVVNFDFPTDLDGYVHRVGRTARNGERGKAISFVGEEDERVLGLVSGRKM